VEAPPLIFDGIRVCTSGSSLPNRGGVIIIRSSPARRVPPKNVLAISCPFSIKKDRGHYLFDKTSAFGFGILFLSFVLMPWAFVPPQFKKAASNIQKT
jgi:hypothetical protein